MSEKAHGNLVGGMLVMSSNKLWIIKHLRKIRQFPHAHPSPR